MIEPVNGKDGTTVLVVKHPLVQAHLAVMRNESTDRGNFWVSAQQVASCLFWVATQNLPTSTAHVKTPMEIMSHPVLSGDFTVTYVARAGYAALPSCKNIYPNSLDGFIDAARDEKTLATNVTSVKLPKGTNGAPAIIADIMLASGNTAITAVNALKKEGASDITFMCYLTAPEGISKLQEAHPDVTIVTAAIDQRLNEIGYIVPGLGDAGDRVFGEKIEKPKASEEAKG